MGLKVHMDGARIFNASVALNLPVREIAAGADTLMFCLSKGLCAPAGSILAGPADLIARGRPYRKALGGGMRQAGVLAGACRVALDEMPKRLCEDHENAKLLAEGLGNVPGIELLRTPVETNIVIFSVANTGMTSSEFAGVLHEDHGVRMSPYVDPTTVRAVTHMDVTREDCLKGIAAVQSVANGGQLRVH